MYTASIVIYKTVLSEIEPLINSILGCGTIAYVYIVDNTASNDIQLNVFDRRVVYIKNNRNIGFGPAHNIAIKQACKKGTSLHFIINPDITVDALAFSDLIASMNSNSDIGLMMPSILNPDGSTQYLPKLLPSPLSILARKLNNVFPIFNSYVKDYEMRMLPSVGLFNIPIVSGCFMVISRSAIEHIGTFDERYFLYFEDWDLSRRIASKYRTAINTSIKVVHNYNSGANRSFKLLFIFISSALKYFIKWGFFIDKERASLNKKALNSIRYV